MSRRLLLQSYVQVLLHHCWLSVPYFDESKHSGSKATRTRSSSTPISRRDCTKPRLDQYASHSNNIQRAIIPPLITKRRSSPFQIGAYWNTYSQLTRSRGDSCYFPYRKKRRWIGQRVCGKRRQVWTAHLVIPWSIWENVIELSVDTMRRTLQYRWEKGKLTIPN